MTSQSQYVHPELIIVDHFDDIINQIDIKTESFTSKKIFESDEKMYIYKWAGIQFETLLEDQSLIDINEAREKQIEKIKEIKQLNLTYLAQKFNEDEYREKWSHVIDDPSLEYKHKIDKIKEELILNDCVLLENPEVYILCITSWFHNQKNLEFLR